MWVNRTGLDREEVTPLDRDRCSQVKQEGGMFSGSCWVSTGTSGSDMVRAMRLAGVLGILFC